MHLSAITDELAKKVSISVGLHNKGITNGIITDGEFLIAYMFNSHYY